MVDAVDLRLAEDAAHFLVQPVGRFEIVAEWLLDDDPPPTRAVDLMVEPDAAQLGHDLGERRRLRREVVEAVAARAVLAVHVVESPRQLVEPFRIVEVAALIGHSVTECLPGGLVEGQDPRVLFECSADLLAERFVVVGPAADRQQHELVGQQVRPPQLVERGDDLAMSQVAGGTEQGNDGRIRDALQPKAIAERVLHRARGRAPVGLAEEPQLAHRPRRLLGARRGMGDLVWLGDRRRPLGPRSRLRRRPGHYSVFTA